MKRPSLNWPGALCHEMHQRPYAAHAPGRGARVPPLPAPPALPTPELASTPPNVPTFGQLLDSGKIGPNRPLILGYDAQTGAAIEGTWEKL